MLKQIICDKFVKPKVIFHKGLNAIVGDELASNSIGKSYMLMIIDFIFGGEDYITKNHDVVENIGHHTFKFSFEFGNNELFFIRSTNEYKYVSICNEKFEIERTIKVEEYTDSLKQNYGINNQDLSFRNIVGRYFRVYGKENLNEKKPIQYFEKESAAKSINALLKLFDKYKHIKVFEKQLQMLKDEKKILTDAAKKNLIPNLTKTLYKQNEKRIIELEEELNKLKESIVSASIEIEALVSSEILNLRQKKSRLVTQKNVLENRLSRTLDNLNSKKVNFKPELEKLIEYFPDFNLEQINRVDNFHESIIKILKQELVNTKKEVKNSIAELTEEISQVDNEINDKLTIKNAPRYAVDKVVELASYIKQLNEENGYYTKKRTLEESIKTAKSNLEELKETSINEVCNVINQKMYELNQLIYPNNIRRAPTLNIHGNKYSFNTHGDTGTGTAFANLIAFDLALLELTPLPAVAHDLPLLKNIENPAIENIVKLYIQSNKQIFLTIDKINSYSNETAKSIIEHRVLQLSKDRLLFNKNWKEEKNSSN